MKDVHYCFESQGRPSFSTLKTRQNTKIFYKRTKFGGRLIVAVFGTVTEIFLLSTGEKEEEVPHKMRF
jgi:hypothetical protein